MSGFDYSLIPTIFIIFQAGTVGLFVLLHFFMGLKRGFFKTTWHFIGQVALVGALFYGLSFLQIADLITEESLGDLLGMIQGFGVNVSQFQEYIDMVVASGALPLVAAIVDLVVKIVVFMLFYWILKYIFQFIIFGIPWFIIIRPIVKDKTKNRILGGLMGAARGAFSGFISIFPMLILMNTIIGQGVVIDDPDYQDLAVYISEANQYNAVRYINDAVQVEEKGLADYVFDLAFSSKVDEDTIITWRSELSWIGEGAKAALPYFLGEEFDQNNITLADVQRFDTFFQSFAESKLLNAALKPGIKAGIMFANGGETPFLTEAEIDEIILKVNGINLDLTNDLQEVYTAVKELLEVQNMNAWMTIADNPGVIGTFDENQQNLITSALTRIATLDLVKLGDVALEVGIYQQAVLDQISWLESDQEKINLLTGVLDKIRAYDGEFISTVLTDVVD